MSKPQQPRQAVIQKRIAKLIRRAISLSAYISTPVCITTLCEGECGCVKIMSLEIDGQTFDIASGPCRHDDLISVH